MSYIPFMNYQTDLYKRVHQIMKHKKSDVESAEKCGITLEEYQDIKHDIKTQSAIAKEFVRVGKEIQEDIDTEILWGKNTEGLVDTHVNFETGEQKLTAITSTQPRSPEEIITLLKIDTTKWKLSQVWQKEKGDKWQISALVKALPQEEKIKEDFFESLSRHILPVVDPLVAMKSFVSDTQHVGVLSLQDLHFGKPGNEDMSKLLEEAITNTVGKAQLIYDFDKILFVVGGDAMNVDSFNATTTKGTIVEQSELPVAAYLKCFDAYVQAIQQLMLYTTTVEVVYMPGNHDRYSSFMLVHALKQAFKSCTNVVFHADYSERKVIALGNNMFCFEHGDVSSKNNPLLYATEFPNEWGKTTYRTLYLGHWHTKKSLQVITENEQNGFTTKYLPSLSATDYWHYHNKFTGNKQAGLFEVHDYTTGKCAEFNFTV